MEDYYTKGIKNYEAIEGTFTFFYKSFAFKPKKVLDGFKKLEYAAYLSKTNFENITKPRFLTHT